MNSLSSLRRTYRWYLLSWLVTLPVFVMLVLELIKPYSPAGVVGWLIIVLGTVGFEVVLIALTNFRQGASDTEATPRWKVIAKITGWAVPGVIIGTVVVLNLLDYVRDAFFIKG